VNLVNIVNLVSIVCSVCMAHGVAGKVVGAPARPPAVLPQVRQVVDPRGEGHLASHSLKLLQETQHNMLAIVSQ